MKNGSLEVLEMEKNPNLMNQNGNEMNDDFFDEDLVDFDFNGLDDANGSNKDLYSEQPTVSPVKEEKIVESANDNVQKIEENVQETKDTQEEVANEGNKNLDDSYVLSNFDVLFDSLYSDVVGANNLITDLIEKKSSLSKNEQLLEDFKEKFEKEKEDFKIFVETQKKAIESEKSQAESYIESKRARLHTEEQKFAEDTEAKKTEISLLEQSLKLEREKFEAEKANFEEKKKIELEQLASQKDKLKMDIETFEKDSKLERQNIDTTKKDLQAQQEQFARYKELEQKKMDLEEKNLSQSCARFKELVSQFNSGFEQLPNDNK